MGDMGKAPGKEQDNVKVRGKTNVHVSYECSCVKLDILTLFPS